MESGMISALDAPSRILFFIPPRVRISQPRRFHLGRVDYAFPAKTWAVGRPVHETGQRSANSSARGREPSHGMGSVLFPAGRLSFFNGGLQEW